MLTGDDRRVINGLANAWHIVFADVIGTGRDQMFKIQSSNYEVVFSDNVDKFLGKRHEKLRRF